MQNERDGVTKVVRMKKKTPARGGGTGGGLVTSFFLVASSFFVASSPSSRRRPCMVASRMYPRPKQCPAFVVTTIVIPNKKQMKFFEKKA